MGDKRCCCRIEGCIILNDDFERTDNDDPGTNWYEAVADTDIDTGTLTQTANSVAITVPQNTSGRGYVSAVIAPTEGAKYRILLGASADGSVYQYVEAHCTAAALILTAGAQTRTYTAADGWSMGETPIVMAACLTQGLLWVNVSHIGFEGCVWDNTATVNNAYRHAGLMNGGSGTIVWDDFIYQQHHQDDPNCPNPACYCEYEDEKGRIQRYYPAWRMVGNYFSPDCTHNGGCAEFEYDCLSAAWLATGGTVAGTALPVGTGLDRLPKITCGFGDRCDWAMSHFNCCDSNPATDGCPDELGLCSDNGAVSLTCGDSETFVVRWDVIVDEEDFTCGTEGLPCGPAGGSYYILFTEGTCP